MTEQLYRCRSIAAPSCYVAEQAGSWARMGNKKEGWQRTQEWWDDNSSPDYRKYFVLEEVE